MCLYNIIRLHSHSHSYCHKGLDVYTFNQLILLMLNIFIKMNNFAFYRERPIILSKPRGRRGRGARGRPISNDKLNYSDRLVETANKIFLNDNNDEDIDPTSSRIKLPRMTEALDKLPSMCGTPLSSRRDSSTDSRKLLSENTELKVVLEELMVKSPESFDTPRGRGRGRGRGSRGGKTPKTVPRPRGRARGGGRGAMYMKVNIIIYKYYKYTFIL